MKICNICHEKLNRTEFHKDVSQKDGFNRTCKKCIKKRYKKKKKKVEILRKIYKCGCGLQYSEPKYIRSGTCKICRDEPEERVYIRKIVKNNTQNAYVVKRVEK